MANSNQDLMRRGGQAIDEMAERTGQGSVPYERDMDAPASAGDTAGNLARAASDAYDDAAEAAGQAYASAAGMARKASHEMLQGAAELGDTLSTHTSRHPFVTLGLAIGIGFVIGAWFAGSTAWHGDSRR